MKNIYTITLRLNLDKPEDREAWEHLQRLDRMQYRSVNRAVIAAVNAYFGRQEQLAADPYLETREKEDAFLKRITEVIEQGLRFAPVGMMTFMPPAAVEAPSAEDDENISAALDFADSF